MGMEGGEVCLLVGFGTLGSRYSSLKRRRMSVCVCAHESIYVCVYVSVPNSNKFGLKAIPKSISTPSLIHVPILIFLLYK